MKDIHFSQIKVSGYRGRKFTLKMNPRGEHTVFVMDGNTGKTTAIDLLRWCFSSHQSTAIGTFDHMWAKPAHVLDHKKSDPQTCIITIQFSALNELEHERFFTFSRVAEGKFDPTYAPVGQAEGDKITSITDTLEIDYGKEVFTGDKAHYYMAQNFRFDNCADYFCFDGEKARDIMRLASDAGQIESLLEMVNKRTTHPTIEAYKMKLGELRERVLAEAKMKISDTVLKQSVTKLYVKNAELANALSDLEEVKNNTAINTIAEKRLRDQFNDLDKQVKETQAQTLIQRNSLEIERQTNNGDLVKKRLSIYLDSAKWLSTDSASIINQIKADIREKGRLPEPYREDLIHDCKTSGKCEICGRPLDKSSMEHILTLERQVAPHPVQVFLSSICSISPSSFDSKANYELVKKMIGNHEELNVKINSIKLSDTDAKIISERDALIPQLNEITKSMLGHKADEEVLVNAIKDLRAEIKGLENKNVALAEYKIILDKIRESEQSLDSVAEIIKAKATEIISQVISQGVSSILGSKFTARLSQAEGLMLGEDNFYSRDTGGNSGRLILSYCFAEAMTLIDPLIVDTPAGNIGSHQENLADHLAANHKQLILLCLPTEMSNFGSRISLKPITIINEER